MASRAEEGDETPLEPIKNRVIRFEEAKYTLRDGEEVFAEATFEVDTSNDPKCMFNFLGLKLPEQPSRCAFPPAYERA
jgi:hypothetical protein